MWVGYYMPLGVVVLSTSKLNLGEKKTNTKYTKDNKKMQKLCQLTL
jgi:hypothetical protein